MAVNVKASCIRASLLTLDGVIGENELFDWLKEVEVLLAQ